jgi:hypothetical protein
VKPRHAVALALVGWYLMMPPSAPSKLWGWWYRLSSEARPLSDWLVYSGYESAKECETVRSELIDFGYGAKAYSQTPSDMIWLGDKGSVPAMPMTDYQMVNVQCVATDDPRLAK